MRLTTASSLLGVAAALAGCGDEPLVSRERAPHDLVDDAAPAVMQLEGTAMADTEPVLARLGPPFPIILVHGFSGFTGLGPVGYFFEVRDHLTALGHDVTTPALPPFSGSGERARVLATVVDEVLLRTGKAKVHLVAHSQGGIDTRVVVSSLGYAGKVASVTTIATPHDGTAVADAAMRAPEGLLNPAGRLLAWLIGGLDQPPDAADWASDETIDAWVPDLPASLRALSVEGTRALVADNPMPAGVPFFTLAGVSNLLSLDNAECAASLWPRSSGVDEVDPVFFATGLLLGGSDGGSLFDPTPNDGLITVASARAPGSTFLGCVPADHADQIGHFLDVVPGLSGFRHKDFYVAIVEHLRTLEE